MNNNLVKSGISEMETPPVKNEKTVKAIILGCGRQGALLAQMLEEEKIEVIVIDKESKAFGRLEKFKGKKILGDGIKEKTLERAGIQDSDAFVAVTNNDNVNLMTAQIAKGIYHVPRVICRVYDPKRAAIYSDLGLDIINLSLSGALLVKNFITSSGAVKKYQLGDGSCVALETKIGKGIAGKKILEIEIPNEFKIAAIIRGSKVLIAEPDIELKTDDNIFGVAKGDILKDIFRKVESDMIDEQLSGGA